MKIRILDRILVAVAGLIVIAGCTAVALQLFFQKDVVGWAGRLIANSSARIYLIIALALQETAFFQTVEQAGKRRRRQADATAEHTGGHARLAGQDLQNHQLHGGQPTKAGQTLGMYFPCLLQAPQRLE